MGPRELRLKQSIEEGVGGIVLRAIIFTASKVVDVLHKFTLWLICVRFGEGALLQKEHRGGLTLWLTPISSLLKIANYLRIGDECKPRGCSEIVRQTLDLDITTSTLWCIAFTNVSFEYLCRVSWRPASKARMATRWKWNWPRRANGWWSSGTTSRRWIRPSSTRWKTWPSWRAWMRRPCCTTSRTDIIPDWSMWVFDSIELINQDELNRCRNSWTRENPESFIWLWKSCNGQKLRVSHFVGLLVVILVGWGENESEYKRSILFWKMLEYILIIWKFKLSYQVLTYC